MASFTDSSVLGALTTYKPYVAQLPVEAMKEVGMYKQAQYNEGVQKIQSQIDNIAGMDVVRDVDKQYLQSKLNEIGSNLKKVAAGDFSNFQLVNSAGGMINQISKDNNILNAVSSTAKYRKGMADMEQAKKEGKSSPSNEWDFMTQANDWLNNTDIKQGFNGGYNPYTNYKKNALDVIKSLTKDESITDDAFTMDAKGNLVISDSTVRKKLAGISPDKIQTALMATLSPADFKQMEIDGRYNYSNVHPAKFVNDLNNSFQEKIGFYNQQKKVLENAKSSTTSNVEKTKLNDQIEALNKTISKISSQYGGMVDMINQGNIEGVKAQLHTANFIDNFSKAFSFTETSQTYAGKTPQEMAMWRADKEQDWKKFMIQRGDELMKFNLSYSQKEKELSLKQKELGGYGGLPQPVDQESLPEITLAKVVEDTDKGMNAIKQADNIFMEQQGKSSEWLAQQKKAWEERPSSVDPVVANHFVNTELQRRNVDSNAKMITEINNEAIAKFGDIKKLIPAGSPTVRYEGPEGQFTYTPEDFVTFNNKFGKYLKPNYGSTSGLPIYDVENAKKELSDKEFHLFELMSNPKGPKNEADETLFNHIQHYGEIVNRPFKKTLDEINKYTAEQVKNRVLMSQGMGYSIPTPNEVTKNSMAGNLLLYTQRAEKQGGLESSPNFDIDVAKKLAADPSAKYNMTVVEGTQYQPRTYEINVSGKEGDISFKVPATDKDIMFGQEFEPSPEIKAFRPYQEQIMKMGGYTTALGKGPSSHENAYLTKIDFPSVQTYGVKANIIQPSPGKYSIRISAFDPVTQKWYEDLSYPRNTLANESEVVPLMQRLNDSAVFELLHEKPATAQDLKTVQQASKKPL